RRQLVARWRHNCQFVAGGGFTPAGKSCEYSWPKPFRRSTRETADGRTWRMTTLVRLADGGQQRRRSVSFDRRELRTLLSLYSQRVATGEWRDYAIDFRPGMAIFSIFRHTAEQPLFAIAKVVPGIAR